RRIRAVCVERKDRGSRGCGMGARGIRKLGAERSQVLVALDAALGVKARAHHPDRSVALRANQLSGERNAIGASRVLEEGVVWSEGRGWNVSGEMFDRTSIPVGEAVAEPFKAGLCGALGSEKSRRREGLPRPICVECSRHLDRVSPGRAWRMSGFVAVLGTYD